jgi:PAS domain S-box-containing protein
MGVRLGKYEVEIRLGLVATIVLLLVLNISSAYLLQQVKHRLTDQVDQRLGGGLQAVALYLAKNQVSDVPQSEARSFAERFEIAGIQASPIPMGRVGTAPSDSGVNSRIIDGLTDSDWGRLSAGEKLFRSSNPAGRRVGLTLIPSTGQARLVLVAHADSPVLATIESAARITLYLGIAVICLIIPAVIILPRKILRPFQQMRETARSAGRLPGADADDNVAEVIRSYEGIIAELKRNETEIERLYRESTRKADRLEKLNEYILKSIGSGVINVDLTGKVIGYNRAAREILGYDEANVLGKHYLVALPREMELGFLVEAGLLRGEVTPRRDLELRYDGGAAVWLAVESSIIYDDYNRVVGTTLLITDVTEIKKLESELEMNRRMAALGEMTGGLAHQLRNSLAAISGFSQLLQKKVGRDSDLSEIAASIRTEAASSEAMVSRFLTFARPLSLMEEVFDPETLLRQCVDKVRVEGTNITIQNDKHLPNVSGSLVGDPLLLKEGITNLIDNAVEAAGTGGQVDIVVSCSDAGAHISISDDGPGIPENLRDKLFTPFVSSKPSGTGLGLALARKIIHLHGGTIALEQRHPHGTTCRIWLPGRAAAEPVRDYESTAAKNQ